MTPASITTALTGITVGMTRVINGHVVTRWSSDRYEIDTWGRNTKTLTDAALIIAA
jgi:hypothetical protein